MGEKWEKVLNKAIGIKGIHINSSTVSAQNRKRIYWTNIGLEQRGLFGDFESTILPPKDKGILLKDILEDEVDEKYFLSEKMLNYLNNKKTVDINLSNKCIIHNLQKRSPDRPSIKKNKNAGGSGHLSRDDGKTYCLDGGNTQAVEIYNNVRVNKTISENELVENCLLDSYNNMIHTDKSITISTRISASNCTHVYKNSRIRKLTPKECERLQTVNDNYTNYVKDAQRYKMLGNGWTINVISHILNHIK
jgi:DNA (cytosine-5)-methyltransferase 3A